MAEVADLLKRAGCVRRIQPEAGELQPNLLAASIRYPHANRGELSSSMGNLLGFGRVRRPALFEDVLHGGVDGIPAPSRTAAQHGKNSILTVKDRAALAGIAHE